MLTRSLHDPDRLPGQALHDFTRPLCIALLVPSLPAVPPRHLSVLVELDSVLLRLGIGGVADESDALIDLEDSRVERGRAADVQVEDLGPRLVADEEEVLEATRDEECMLMALALEQRVGRDSR